MSQGYKKFCCVYDRYEMRKGDFPILFAVARLVVVNKLSSCVFLDDLLLV